MIYSMSGICSKLASGEKFLSPHFCLYYAIIILLLGFYAIGWQQIIKRLPLTTAFANKAVTVVWGIIWGAVFFRKSYDWKSNWCNSSYSWSCCLCKCGWESKR